MPSIAIHVLTHHCIIPDLGQQAMKVKWKTKAIVEISSSVYKFQFLFAADILFCLNSVINSRFCIDNKIYHGYNATSASTNNVAMQPSSPTSVASRNEVSHSKPGNHFHNRFLIQKCSISNTTFYMMLHISLYNYSLVVTIHCVPQPQPLDHK